MIRRFFVTSILCLVAGVAQTQSLTSGQLTTVRAAACADATAKTYINSPNVPQLQSWANTATATRGWLTAAATSAIEEAPSYTTYDTLAQGKRDSWVVLLRNPRDFTKQKIRNWVTDVWGNATAASNAETVLLAGSELATNAQVAVGGTSRTTGTVTALDRGYTGQVGTTDATRLIFADNGTQFTCP
jgi:hypothetical protein